MTFIDDSAYRQPDSASWRFKGGEGAAKLGVRPGRSEYTATFELPSMPESEIVDLVCWRNGIRSYVVKGSGSGELTVLVAGATDLGVSFVRLYSDLDEVAVDCIGLGCRGFGAK